MARYLNQWRCTFLGVEAALLDLGVDFEHSTFLVDLIQLDPLDVP